MIVCNSLVDAPLMNVIHRLVVMWKNYTFSFLLGFCTDEACGIVNVWSLCVFRAGERNNIMFFKFFIILLLQIYKIKVSDSLLDES